MALRSDVIRVLISGLPDLHASIVEQLVADEPDMVVVDPRAARADVVLVQPPQVGDTHSGLARLRGVGDSNVLAVDAEHGDIVGVVSVAGDEAWPAKVVAAIRAAAPDRSPRHRRSPP